MLAQGVIDCDQCLSQSKAPCAIIITNIICVFERDGLMTMLQNHVSQGGEGGFVLINIYMYTSTMALGV